MKSVRLTRRAQRRLADIFHFSIEQWGDGVARRYRDGLIQKLRALAEGELPEGRSCDTLISSSQPLGLKYFREGGQYIIYRETENELHVLDFVHQSRNLEGIIQNLATSGGTENNEN